MIKYIGKQKKCILILLAGLWLLYLFANRNVFQATENLQTVVKLQKVEQTSEEYIEMSRTMTVKQNYLSGLEVRLNKETKPDKVIISIANEKGKMLNQYLVEPQEEIRKIEIHMEDELYVGKNNKVQLTVQVYADGKIRAPGCTVYYYPFLKLECITALLCEVIMAVIILWDILRGNSYLCKPDKRISFWIILLLALQAVLSFCLMELTFQNPVVGNVEWKLVFWNWGIIFAVYLILMFLFNSVKAAVMTAGFFFQIWGIANRFVYLFKGQAVQPVDLKSIATAATVASEYDYTLTWEMRLTISVLLLSFVLWLRISDRKVICNESIGKKAAVRIPGIVLACITGFVLFRTSVIPDMHLATNMWRTRECFHDQGTVVAFCNYWHNMQIDKPEGYSAEMVNDIAEKYVKNRNEAADTVDDSTSDRIQPNIIVIMNEAFADLNYYGEFKTNIPYMENYNAITENAVKGYALVNIYGAGTANSEYEYLTGHSLTFMPNSIPYAEHIQENHYSMATTLAAQGYERTAIHPMQARNWRRNVVYPNFGFEEFYSTDNMDFSEVTYHRNYISDAHTYKMVMDVLKEEDDAPDLILDITVQNHGGYKYVNEDFHNDVHIIGYDSYAVDQYLSLISICH